jgi:hypothetical protein
MLVLECTGVRKILHTHHLLCRNKTTCSGLLPFNNTQMCDNDFWNLATLYFETVPFWVIQQPLSLRWMMTKKEVEWYTQSSHNGRKCEGMVLSTLTTTVEQNNGSVVVWMAFSKYLSDVVVFRMRMACRGRNRENKNNTNKFSVAIAGIFERYTSI